MKLLREIGRYIKKGALYTSALYLMSCSSGLPGGKYVVTDACADGGLNPVTMQENDTYVKIDLEGTDCKTEKQDEAVMVMHVKNMAEADSIIKRINGRDIQLKRTIDKKKSYKTNCGDRNYVVTARDFEIDLDDCPPGSL
jgi:hypothetical protein